MGQFYSFFSKMAKSALKTVTTYKALLISVGIGLVGLAMLLLPDLFPALITSEKCKTVLTNFGGFLFASIAVALIWELTIKRQFLSEIYEVSRTSAEIKESGLSGVSVVFYQQDWENYFKNVKELDVFISYGQTWRSSNRQFLEQVAARSGAVVRFVLPNPSNPQLISELARRFHKTDAVTKTRIEDSIVEYNKIFKGKACKYDLYLTDRAPLFGIYRFDHQMIVTIFTQGSAIKNVPVLQMDKQGSLPNFFVTEFEDLITTNVGHNP